MPEFEVHSFIVKLWLKDEARRQEMSGWQGHITHVPSGARRYLKDLDDIVAFVKPYVGQSDTTLRFQIRRWWKARFHLREK